MGWPITFQPSGNRIDAPRGVTILEAARMGEFALKRILESPCGGLGVCGRCRVRILDGEASLPSQVEHQFLSTEDLEQNLRLACQAVPLTPLVVETLPVDLGDSPRIELAGLDTDVDLDPPVRLVDFPSPDGIIGEETALLSALRSTMEEVYDLPGLTVDPELGRQITGDFLHTPLVATVRDHEIINLRPRALRPRALGLAVDLGTTKIAGYLVDLESGHIVAAEGLLNPQLPFGSDLVSRLAEALKDERTREDLSRVLVQAIQELALRLTERVGAVSSDVEEAVVAANTAMHHLFLNLPVDRLTKAPYVPAVTEPILAKARDIGLRLAPGAYVYMTPPIGGFIGGDHVAMILATGLHQADSPTLGLDIGTNTEIALGHDGTLTCCSCASGPAFEGGHLSQGMRAAKGALASLRLGPQGNVVRHDTIGGDPPLGLCGSGSLDTVAELVRLKIINENGLLDPSHPRVRNRNDDGHPEFLLFSREECEGPRDIVMTQKDISEIQLAKAAIAAGVELLLQSAGLTPDQLSGVLVAGAFGSWLNPLSAVSVGMLPDVPLQRISRVGNAAGAGAVRSLVSVAERRGGEELAHRANKVDLANNPLFGGAFARALRFNSRSDNRDV